MLLAVKVTSAFDTLTRPERVKVLVLDDSVVKRNRSKSVELLARIYDHVEHKFQKGFTLLTLGCSDGYMVYNKTHAQENPAYRNRCDRDGKATEAALYLQWQAVYASGLKKVC